MTAFWIVAAGLNGIVAVGAGAVGSPLLARDPRAAGWMSLGAQYEMVHALARLAVALLAREAVAQGYLLCGAGGLFLAGCILFSGGLYDLALAGPTLLGRIVPYGGIAFMLGWLLLA